MLRSIQKHSRLIVLVVFLLIIFCIFQYSGLRAQFNLTFIKQAIQSHELAGLLLFVLLFTLGNLIQIPGWVFLAAAVLALGEWLGGLATYIAAVTACTTTFFLIRWVGGNALRQLTNPLALKALKQLDARPILSMVVLRTLLQTAPPLNYVLAISGVKFRDYLLACLFGLPLPIMLYCVFFDTLAKLLKIT
ncbi:MAG TPA: VTT domain-containing protein [Methylophilaceae bacterium]|jgi:uncharacterized membrane protein YdjX (TVP38/TMEM64 family)